MNRLVSNGRLALALALFALLVASPAGAQTVTTGAISGLVTDESGGVLPVDPGRSAEVRPSSCRNRVSHRSTTPQNARIARATRARTAMERASADVLRQRMIAGRHHSANANEPVIQAVNSRSSAR